MMELVAVPDRLGNFEGQPVTWQQYGVQYAAASGYGGVYSLFRAMRGWPRTARRIAVGVRGQEVGGWWVNKRNLRPTAAYFAAVGLYHCALIAAPRATVEADTDGTKVNGGKRTDAENLAALPWSEDGHSGDDHAGPASLSR